MGEDELKATLLDDSEGAGGEVFAERFEIRRLLGRGGMGAVYEALDRSVGDVVALKTLTSAGGLRNEALERFRREVRLARRITHRHVARIHDLGEHQGVHYLTMEYVEGGDLQSLLESNDDELGLERAVQIARQVCQGLAAAHEAGVVHRDLKPGNVLLEKDSGRVVLTDFGIARSLADEVSSLKTAGTLGTPLYMAPEQVTGGEVDARADVFAFGVMLWEMLVGKPPYFGPTAIATAMARVQSPAPDPREHAGVPDALADLVLRCLEREPADRPSSVAEVAEQLAELEDDLTIPPPPPRSPASGGAETQAATSARRDAARPGARAGATPTGPTLAVLPFRYRGGDEHDYLGEALTDDLVDLLSRTAGLRVLASSATRRYVDTRDPKTVGVELSANAVVDGTVQARGDRMRVSVRLVDVTTEVQVWSERFDTEIADVFELQDRMSRRIAEALRVSLTTSAPRDDLPPEAVELYLRSRRLRRGELYSGEDGALALLDRCVELAPDFEAAVASHAICSVRMWFFQGTEWGTDFEEPARHSVARALDRASGEPDTQLASAMLAVQDGDYETAAQALGRVLDLAPTHAEAQQYLGELLCEAGRVEEGARRVRAALDLNPTLLTGLFAVARVHELRGEREQADAIYEQLRRDLGDDYVGVVGLGTRIAAVRGDEEGLRRIIARLEGVTTPALFMMGQLARAFLGEVSAGDVLMFIQKQTGSMPINPRARTLMTQILAEAHAAQGDVEGAIELIRAAVDDVLMDVDWLDRNPLLEPVRQHPAFTELRDRTARRAAPLLRF